jgi:hypothetical protein
MNYEFIFWEFHETFCKWFVVTMNYEFIFWEFHETFLIFTGLKYIWIKVKSCSPIDEWLIALLHFVCYQPMDLMGVYTLFFSTPILMNM